MQLFDTHTHIYLDDYGLDADQVIADAKADGVTQALLVGTSLEESRQAIAFARSRTGFWATVGLHPEFASRYATNQPLLAEFSELIGQPKVVGVGECGLDYFYQNASKKDQAALLHFQLALAEKHQLPLSFHVREAFEDFWPIFDQYKDLRGVVHSFTADRITLDEVLARGLYVGLNGIMTFTKKDEQLLAAKAVPLNRLVLETDAPYLTPTPYRGTICQLKHLRVTAEFLANLRGESLGLFGDATTRNAHQLFKVR